MDNAFRLERVKQNIQQLKRDLPVVLANDAQRFFIASWRKQGWDDGGVKSWEKPKRWYKQGNSTRLRSATLVQSGALRRAANNSIRQVSFVRSRLVIDLPYAARHNEGLKGMPKRQYMGDSKTLRVLQVQKINKAIDQLWKR